MHLALRLNATNSQSINIFPHLYHYISHCFQNVSHSAFLHCFPNNLQTYLYHDKISITIIFQYHFYHNSLIKLILTSLNFLYCTKYLIYVFLFPSHLLMKLIIVRNLVQCKEYCELLANCLHLAYNGDIFRLIVLSIFIQILFIYARKNTQRLLVSP